MGQDKTGYKRDAILIEASRILSPQFNPLGIYLTGAEVELLRNTVSVLGKPTTFVDEYHNGYYTTPTDSDWDIILSIVADLERKLMGNDNVIFSYNDRYLENWSNNDHAAGIQWLETMPVPSGYVYVVTQISILQTVTSGSYQHLLASDDVISIYLGFWLGVQPGKPNIVSVHIPLKEEDYIRATWGNTAEDEVIAFSVWGYKMKVPD